MDILIPISIIILGIGLYAANHQITQLQRRIKILEPKVGTPCDHVGASLCGKCGNYHCNKCGADFK
jgi:hypothetical protein